MQEELIIFNLMVQLNIRRLIKREYNYANQKLRRKKSPENVNISVIKNGVNKILPINALLKIKLVN